MQSNTWPGGAVADCTWIRSISMLHLSVSCTYSTHCTISSVLDSTPPIAKKYNLKESRMLISRIMPSIHIKEVSGHPARNFEPKLADLLTLDKMKMIHYLIAICCVWWKAIVNTSCSNPGPVKECRLTTKRTENHNAKTPHGSATSSQHLPCVRTKVFRESYLNFPWKSCAKKHSLANTSKWHIHLLHNSANLRLKPHIQHAVCLIQSQIAHHWQWDFGSLQ